MKTRAQCFLAALLGALVLAPLAWTGWTWLAPEPPSTFKVVISGQVRMPGRYEVPAGSTLSDLIKRAGGHTGNERNIVNETSPVNISRLMGSQREWRLERKQFRCKFGEADTVALKPDDLVQVGAWIGL